VSNGQKIDYEYEDPQSVMKHLSVYVE